MDERPAIASRAARTALTEEDLMTNESQPHDQRKQQIADLRDLVDFLDAHPDLPVGNLQPGYHCLTSTDDEAGMAELHRIAAILGTEVTGEGHTHRYARRRFGTWEYEAYYILREHMAAHMVESRHISALRTCGCGAKLTDADLVAGKKRCAACVPGEAVES
jgi:hypothetical protein